MDFNRFKELVRKLGGVLIMEEGEPEFIVLSYDKYQKIENGEEVPRSTAVSFSENNGKTEAEEVEEQKLVDRLNQEILALKEEIREKEEAELLENADSGRPEETAIDLD